MQKQNFRAWFLTRCKSQQRMSRALQSLDTGSSIKDVLKEFLKIMITKRFLLFTGMYVILLYRMQMGLSHFNPWLDYTYSDLAASCEKETVSDFRSQDDFLIFEKHMFLVDVSLSLISTKAHLSTISV